MTMDFSYHMWQTTKHHICSSVWEKIMLVKKKNAIGTLLMAMKTLTHLCETVLLIE